MSLKPRAREQAGGLDHWAAVLEVHEPKSSAAGIVMLREAAKTLRELAADAPPEPTLEMVEAGAALLRTMEWGCTFYVDNDKGSNEVTRKILRAALAAVPKEG